MVYLVEGNAQELGQALGLKADIAEHSVEHHLMEHSRQILIQLGYTEDMPKFFANPEKRKELEYIHSLANIDVQKLCLIFWAKGELTHKGYKKIVQATIDYPMLAETLVVLDQTHRIPIKSLKRLALNPLQHQQQSILYHFAPQLSQAGLKKHDLKPLDVEALSDLSKSFSILKKIGVTTADEYPFTADEYTLALRNNKQGQLLRLFLPGLDKIANFSYQRELIKILYIGINKGSIHQDKAIQAITDKDLLVLAQNLHERFICVKQMQDLDFKKEIITLAGEEGGLKGRRFRKVILAVEEQCKLVHERLRESGADKEQAKNWQITDKDYRRTLYYIAYDGITKADVNIRARINQAEIKVLNIVDPEIQSWLSKILIIIANIVITTLTLGLANAYKKRSTGNYWFFNHTRLGEQFRALNNEVMDVTDSPDPEPASISATK